MGRSIANGETAGKLNEAEAEQSRRPPHLRGRAYCRGREAAAPIRSGKGGSRLELDIADRRHGVIALDNQVKTGDGRPQRVEEVAAAARQYVAP